jgi:hypothetical protein
MPVTVPDERLNQKNVGSMFSDHFVCVMEAMRTAANTIPLIPPEDCSHPLFADTSVAHNHNATSARAVALFSRFASLASRGDQCKHFNLYVLHKSFVPPGFPYRGRLRSIAPTSQPDLVRQAGCDSVPGRRGACNRSPCAASISKAFGAAANSPDGLAIRPYHLFQFFVNFREGVDGEFQA